LYAELLKEELGEFYEDGLRRIDVIISESQRLSRLIQNILTFSHAPKIHIQAVDIGQLMAQIVQTFTPSFQARGMVLSLDMGESVSGSVIGSVMIDSDLDRLTQILSNFLSNAEKYASSGQRVDLTVESHPDYLDIHVRDYGPGISEKEAKKIFQPFYRIQSAITEGVAGTGIGLTIARQLAESLHGEILLSHPSPGMQFTLRLKKQAARN
jgi:signal transduction histidine kinase